MPDALALSHAVIPLLKGPIYRDQHEHAWKLLLEMRPAVSDYVEVMGLGLMIDETEGYAYLRTLPESDYPEGAETPPRLVPRRQLSFHVSLLLALLRRRLAELDAEGTQPRLFLTTEQMRDMLWHFMPDEADQTRLFDRMDQHMAKAEQLGFLRAVKGQSDTWEVRRVLKSFVDAETLDDFETRLEEYLVKLSGGEQS